MSSCLLHKYRGVVSGGAGGARESPNFGRSVNPISTRGDRLCPPDYYWNPQIFRSSDGPADKTPNKIVGVNCSAQIFWSFSDMNKYYLPRVLPNRVEHLSKDLRYPFIL